MPHDETPLDNWYHEVVAELTKSRMNTYLAERYLRENESVTEIAMLLKKANDHHEKVICLLREDYYERKRLENTGKGGVHING